MIITFKQKNYLVIEENVQLFTLLNKKVIFSFIKS